MKLKKFNFKTIKSTNDSAIRIIKNSNVRCGIIIAEKQTSGRGQYGKTWFSFKGNLFVSIFFPINEIKLTLKNLTKFNCLLVKKLISNYYKGKIFITDNPIKAANLADCIMTDKWISMGDKINKNKKKKALKHYQVNKKIMSVAKKDSIFMHCLPASRGEEVSNDVIDGKQSAVWLEALNRIHAQKSIIEWCLNKGLV